jgi:tRNA-uridine 2-sulfurtransferase
VLRHFPAPGAAEFILSNIGRQLWNDGRWLVMGRNKADNERLRQLRREEDILLDVVGFPGPLGLARPVPQPPMDGEPPSLGRRKGGLLLPQSHQLGRTYPGPHRISRTFEDRDGPPQAALENGWHEPTWEQALEEKKEQEKLRRDEASG